MFCYWIDILWLCHKQKYLDRSQLDAVRMKDTEPRFSVSFEYIN